MDSRVSPAPAQLAAELVGAINSREPERLSRLLDDRSRVVTGRTAHEGAEAILAWASREYDHLVRRYAIDEYRTRGDSVLALGAVEYAWSESGEVGDSAPIALLIELADGRLRALSLHDDAASALAEFEARES